MPLVLLHHLLNVFVQLANKRGFKQTQNNKAAAVYGKSHGEGKIGQGSQMGA
jgi:hypothetical protein